MVDFAGNFLAGHMGAREQARSDQQQANANALAPLQRESLQLGMDQTRQNMALSQEKMQILRQQAAQQSALAIKTQADAEAAQADIQQGRRLIAAAAAGGPGAEMAWRELAAGLGNPDLEFSRESLALAGEVFSGLEEGFLSAAGNAAFGAPRPAPMSPQGKLYADQQAGAVPAGTFEAQTAPKGPLVDMSGANFGPQGGDVTDDFYKTLDKGMADMYTGLLDTGMTVPSKLAQIDELDRVLSTAPEGIRAYTQYAAGNYGISTEGLSELQAAQAIINRLVPAQRQPGSGPMSDADLELFKQSLPRLINTREGNQTIINTMRGLAMYEAQQAEIANKVARRELSPQEGTQALSQLQNPLQQFRRQGQTTIGGYTIREVD